MEKINQKIRRSVFTKNFYKIGAFINFILAVAHLACVPFLSKIFEIYDITKIMKNLAFYGSWIPYAITVAMFFFFGICGIYGLSSSKIIRPLPCRKFVMVGIIAAFLSRGTFGIIKIFVLQHVTIVAISSVIIAFAVGFLYLAGMICEKE